MKLLTPTNVDDLLNLPDGKSERMARAGKLPHIKLPGGEIRFDEQAVMDLIKAGEVVTSAPPESDFCGLSALAVRLRMPSKVVRELAREKKIPSIPVGSVLMFRVSEVEEALGRLAETSRATDMQAVPAAVGGGGEDGR